MSDQRASPALSTRDALQIVQDEMNPDYHKYLQAMLENLNRKLDGDFKDYIDMILSDPGAWIASFPDSLRRATGLYKPKTAMLKLLKHERVVQALGKDFCDGASGRIKATWKVQKAQEEAKRSSSNITPVPNLLRDDDHGDDDLDDDDLDDVPGDNALGYQRPIDPSTDIGERVSNLKDDKDKIVSKLRKRIDILEAIIFMSPEERNANILRALIKCMNDEMPSSSYDHIMTEFDPNYVL